MGLKCWGFYSNVDDTTLKARAVSGQSLFMKKDEEKIMERTKERLSFRKKFIGDRKFYMMVLAVAVPIMIQNGITNFVSLLDNIMIGRIGTEQMSGASIVNQLIFVYNLGIRSGYFHGAVFWTEGSRGCEADIQV